MQNCPHVGPIVQYCMHGFQQSHALTAIVDVRPSVHPSVCHGDRPICVYGRDALPVIDGRHCRVVCHGTRQTQNLSQTNIVGLLKCFLD